MVERKDFFQALQGGLSEKGNQVVWPQVAANVSNALESVNAWYCVNCKDASIWVDQVGASIMKSGRVDFQSIYNSENPLKGIDAQHWDATRLINEQMELQPFYDSLKARHDWSYRVIIVGGGINAGMDIFDLQNRINYGQQQLNSARNGDRK